MLVCRALNKQQVQVSVEGERGGMGSLDSYAERIGGLSIAVWNQPVPLAMSAWTTLAAVLVYFGWGLAFS